MREHTLVISSSDALNEQYLQDTEQDHDDPKDDIGDGFRGHLVCELRAAGLERPSASTLNPDWWDTCILYQVDYRDRYYGRRNVVS